MRTRFRTVWIVAGLALVSAAVVVGSGTNYVPKYNSSGTLVDSNIVDVNGNIGIGTATPTAKLDVYNGYVRARDSGNNNPPTTGKGIELIGFQDIGWLYAFNRDASTWMQLVLGGNPITTIGGYFGVNTFYPDAQLHVVGTTHLEGATEVEGNLTVTGNIAAKYQDVAEWVDASEALPAGTVVTIRDGAKNAVERSARAYDTAVAGVISAQPGIQLGEKAPGRLLVAQSGRVKVKADASAGAIAAGDLLVTSTTAGRAMKSVPVKLDAVEIHRPGTILGKALEPLATGTGEILVLVTLQ